MKKIKILLCVAFFAFSASIYAQPVLGMTTFFTNTTTALNANTACTITKTVTLSGWLFSISSTSNCGHNWTNSTGGDGRFQNLVGFGNLTQISFGSDDGSPFALQNLTWGVSTSSWTSKSMKFVGYRLGLPVPGATLNATTPSGTGILNTLVIQFTTNPAFNNVDNIVLAPNSSTCNSILFFEDITVGSACSSTLTLTGQTNILCNGGSTGSATMNASGSGPFTYTWSPSGGNAATATGLSAGIYTCVVTNSCGTTVSQTVNITQPPSVVGSTAVTNPLCNGAQGSATVSASGGTAPYTYTWSSGPTSSVEPTLLAGTYTVKVIDAFGCNITKSVTITQPAALVTATAVTNVLCFGGANGSATVTASGGSFPYSYSWSGAQTTSVITGQTPGIKTVTVTDGNGCSKTATVNISQPPALATATTVANVLCFGSATGFATVTASGGSIPYSYSWSGGQTTSIITGQTSGIKTVTVTDGNGCSKTATVNISQPPALITATAVTSVLCFGGATGAATVTASGGSFPYSYSWSGAQTTSVISSQSSGIKTVTVTDGNGCTKTATVNISQPASGLATATAVTNVSCFGGANGTATVTASGGSFPYSYSWSGAQTTSVVTGQTPGIKTVTVTDANGCTASNTINISQPTAINLIASGSSTICQGASITLTANATGGTGTLSYTWNPGILIGANQTVTPSSNQTYTVIAADINGCTIGTTLAVTVGNSPTITSNNGVICSGGSFTIVPSGANTYTISGGSSVVTPTSNASYNVTGTSSLGCVSSNTAVSSVTVNALPVITVPSATICAGATGTLTASGASTYTWNTGSNASSISASPVTTTTYTANGTSSVGCLGSAVTATITVGAAPSIVVNSATICAGNSATLNASGVTTYTWNTGANSASIVVTPTANTTYSVSGNLTGCGVGANNTSSVAVNALPSVNAVSNTSLLCVGQSASLTASGAASYTWSTGGNASTEVISPSVTSTYTVNGTDANGCSNVTTITQSVSACTGIQSSIINQQLSINVYPNPSNGVFFIEIATGSTSNIFVVDVLGKVLYNQQLKDGKHSINLTNLTNGLYILKAESNGTVKTVRLIKD